MEHNYKVWPNQFRELLAYSKTFEWRKDDRIPGPQVNDVFIGHEFSPANQTYSGRQVRRLITSVLRHDFGIPAGYVVFSLEDPRVKGGA